MVCLFRFYAQIKFSSGGNSKSGSVTNILILQCSGYLNNIYAFYITVHNTFTTPTNIFSENDKSLCHVRRYVGVLVCPLFCLLSMCFYFVCEWSVHLKLMAEVKKRDKIVAYVQYSINILIV